jgi:hypothetical protein
MLFCVHALTRQLNKEMVVENAELQKKLSGYADHFKTLKQRVSSLESLTKIQNEDKTRLERRVQEAQQSSMEVTGGPSDAMVSIQEKVEALVAENQVCPAVHHACASTKYM